MTTFENKSQQNEDSLLSQPSDIKSRINNSTESIPRSRTKHSSCLSCGHLYVFGGRDGTLGLKDSWRYNIERHTWEKLELIGSQLPHLEDHSSVAIDDKIVIFGGNFESDQSSPLWLVDTNDLNCSSISIEDTPVPLSRRGHAACCHGDDLYVFGGFLDFLGCTDELWRLAAVASKSPKWELLHGLQIASKSFGHKNSRLSPDGLKSAQAGEPSPQTSSSGSGPSPRCYQASVIMRDDLYIHGGERGQKILASFWRWNIVTGCWVHLKSKPSPPPLKRHTMVAAGQTTLLVMGGETTANSSDFVFWGFNVNTSSWFKLADPSSEDLKINLSRFVTVNVSEVNEHGDGLSLVTLWNDSDTTSVGNVTEITDFSVGVSSNFCHDDDAKNRSSNHKTDRLVVSEDRHRFPGSSHHHESHREAARKLSGHRLAADSVSFQTFPSPLHAKTSNDIEMENLDDRHRLLHGAPASEGLLIFDNDCFDFDEPLGGKEGFATMPDVVIGTFRSEDGVGNVVDLSLIPRMRRMKKERKCHQLALVGGKKKHRRELATSPLSMVLLSCDQVTHQIIDVVLF